MARIKTRHPDASARFFHAHSVSGVNSDDAHERRQRCARLRKRGEDVQNDRSLMSGANVQCARTLLVDEQAAETPSAELKRLSEHHARPMFVLVALPPRS